MRRQDREAMRGKTPEASRSDRDDSAAPEFEPKKREQVRGGPTSSDQQKPSSPRPSGRLPLPD